MKTFIISLLLLMSSAFGAELNLGNYLKMQESLAADNMPEALAAHQVICTKELNSFKDKYKDCLKKFKSIEEIRESFKVLSEIYIKNGNLKEMKALMKATCPMARANWVQKNGALRNPYYGKSMLECGEKI